MNKENEVEEGKDSHNWNYQEQESRRLTTNLCLV